MFKRNRCLETFGFGWPYLGVFSVLDAAFCIISDAVTRKCSLVFSA